MESWKVVKKILMSVRGLRSRTTVNHIAAGRILTGSWYTPAGSVQCAVNAVIWYMKI